MFRGCRFLLGLCLWVSKEPTASGGLRCQLVVWKGIKELRPKYFLARLPTHQEIVRAETSCVPVVFPFQAVDLLLTSFCQNVMAASRFSPPDR